MPFKNFLPLFHIQRSLMVNHSPMRPQFLIVNRKFAPRIFRISTFPGGTAPHLLCATNPAPKQWKKKVAITTSKTIFDIKCIRPPLNKFQFIITNKTKYVKLFQRPRIKTALRHIAKKQARSIKENGANPVSAGNRPPRWIPELWRQHSGHSVQGSLSRKIVRDWIMSGSEGTIFSNASATAKRTSHLGSFSNSTSAKLISRLSGAISSQYPRNPGANT